MNNTPKQISNIDIKMSDPEPFSSSQKMEKAVNVPNMPSQNQKGQKKMQEPNKTHIHEERPLKNVPTKEPS
jgi:hypothetical protein